LEEFCGLFAEPEDGSAGDVAAGLRANATRVNCAHAGSPFDADTPRPAAALVGAALELAIVVTVGCVVALVAGFVVFDGQTRLSH
jgi:hypothetical protein